MANIPVKYQQASNIYAFGARLILRAFGLPANALQRKRTPKTDPISAHGSAHSGETVSRQLGKLLF
jgi:hypothetical protein